MSSFASRYVRGKTAEKGQETMMTMAQAMPVVLAAGGLSSSVAVAAAALVVVLTIVLVFVMVLRSSNSGRRSSTGLGYDAPSGPLGQPQNAVDDPGWHAPAAAPGERGWGQQYGESSQQGGAWGDQQSNAWGSQQSNAWGPGADQGGWNGQSRVPSPSQPMAPAAQADWGARGTPSRPGQTPSRPGWSAAAPVSSPWDQGAAGPASGPAWGPAQPTIPAAGPAPQAAGGWAGQQASGGGWNGAPAQAASGGGWNGAPAQAASGGGWNGAPAANNGWGSAPAAQRLGVLVVRQGKEPGKSFELRKERMTLGRSRESDIFLEDLAVSRLHTTVLQDGTGRYILRDEGSANGTYVNQQRVTEQVLEEGDEIQVGQTILIFNWR
jgi:hypothetical protein